MIKARTLLLLFAALACALLAVSVTGNVMRQALTERFAAQAMADVKLRQALLASEVARFRLLPLALGDDRDLVATVQGKPGAQAVMNAKLEHLAADVGAAVIYIIRGDGLTLSASNWRDPRSFIGKNYGFRPYFRDAAVRGEAEQFALGTVSRKPGLYLARRAAGGSVVVVKLEFDRVETQWRAATGVTFVTDRSGVIVVTSRPGWRFAQTSHLTSTQARLARERIGVPALAATPFTRIGQGRIAIAGARGEWLLISTRPDASGWRAHLALPLRDVVDAQVRVAQGLAALAVLALFAAGALLQNRRRRRRERTLQLESAVAERTADLRREIDERIAAEQQAAHMREGLRQANRLATLGQITASVAHETAQPVAAIRNYAVSSQKLLDLGESQDVRDNLRAIDRLAGRIGEVTAELRGFARKGSRAGGPVPLVEVLDGACLLLKEGLSRVAFVRPALAPDLLVLGGHVRLEQVFVNVLQNALEALADSTSPRIVIAADLDGDAVRVLVSDNGPGIAPDVAERLFTPFATSRASGLGLGLVIAKDIMEDFGGSLSLVPTAQGACFAIVLRQAS